MSRLDPMTSELKAPERGQSDWLLTTAILAVVATFVRAIFFTPLEARQGAAQKIYYVHPPSAFVALYLAFGLVALAAHDLLPGYARRFSLKRAAQVEPNIETVYCYPQPFDAVSFYR